jgi:hypothetical protein
LGTAQLTADSDGVAASAIVLVTDTFIVTGYGAFDREQEVEVAAAALLGHDP